MHKSLSNGVLSVIIEDRTGDTKKAGTGGSYRIRELCGRLCYKKGCKIEHSLRAEGELRFSYLLQYNKSAPN